MGSKTAKLCHSFVYKPAFFISSPVDLYRTSISNNLYGAQQQDRAQQQELARNVARPTNDGYQN